MLPNSSYASWVEGSKGGPPHTFLGLGHPPSASLLAWELEAIHLLSSVNNCQEK